MRPSSPCLEGPWTAPGITATAPSRTAGPSRTPWTTVISDAVGVWYRRWRREAHIRRAAQDLRRFDVYRLRDLGVIDRSGIDLVVYRGRDPRARLGD